MSPSQKANAGDDVINPRSTPKEEPNEEATEEPSAEDKNSEPSDEAEVIVEPEKEETQIS